MKSFKFKDFKAAGFSDSVSRMLALLAETRPTYEFALPFLLFSENDDRIADEIYKTIKESEIRDPDTLLKLFFLRDADNSES